jgi:dTDP-glucose pyrophosphorylase
MKDSAPVMNIADLKRLFVSPQHSMLEVMQRINETAQGIGLVVDAEGRLLDTVTDGDLRRAVLAGIDLQKPIMQLRTEQHRPFTMPVGTPRDELAKSMRERRVRHIPLIDAERHPVDMVQLSDLWNDRTASRSVSAVLMAGGYGARLRPLTNEIPKPMLPLGDKPLVEHTIDSLRKFGIQRVYMATHYKPEVFSDHFGDGRAFGVQIDYIHEDQPRGTAGVLAALPPGDDPLLVINGDIVTDVSYEAMLQFHQETGAEMTVGIRRYEFSVPYGVMEMNGSDVLAVKEKPTHRFFVNAGVYLLERSAAQQVPPDSSFDMPQLIETLVSMNKKVIGFPISEYWLDIGRISDYEKARSDAEAGRCA